MFYKSDDTIPLHNFVRLKEPIVARFHIVYWYIHSQDDNRNNFLARRTFNHLDHHFRSWNFYQGTSCVQRYMDTKTRRTIRRFNGTCKLNGQVRIMCKDYWKNCGAFKEIYIRKVCKDKLLLPAQWCVLKPSTSAKVTGKRCNLGDGERMQVPSKLSLSGQPKFVSLLRKELMKMKEI